jgi:hypothetical protein
VLQNRLRDSTWTIVFKSLIIVHFMIREGEPNVTLKYLSSSPQRKLAINNFTEGTYDHIVELVFGKAGRAWRKVGFMAQDMYSILWPMLNAVVEQSSKRGGRRYHTY